MPDIEFDCLVAVTDYQGRFAVADLAGSTRFQAAGDTGDEALRLLQRRLDDTFGRLPME